MRCPILIELPPPPQGKKGWPWTEESKQLPETKPDGSPWPLISIVTPSYNQAIFIEETIRSILLQGYPNLEYIIIDGKSTDNSVAVIQKYKKWLTYWVSEPDKGQSEAINKGWNKCNGEIIAWINSDDFYCINVFELAIKSFTDKSNIDLLYGDCNCLDKNSNKLGILKNLKFDLRRQMTGRNLILQPSTFFKRKILNKVGNLDTSLHFVMDYDLWVRILLANGKFQYIPTILSNYRVHDEAKSIASQFQVKLEIKKVLDRIYQGKSVPDIIRPWKRKAYSNFHRSVGEAYLINGQRALARKEFLQAIFQKPFQPGIAIMLSYLLDTWLGTNVGIFMQRLGWRLRNDNENNKLWEKIIRDY